VTSTEFLSPLVLDFVWESLDIGELPYPLELRSHGDTMDERSALRHRVLGAVRGDDFEDWLTILARADRSVDAILQADGDGPTAALAAALDGRALLATQNRNGLWLRRIDPGSLASSIVDLLPAAPRGTEPSISMPAEELAAGGRTHSDRRALETFAKQRNHRAGQLAVNTRRAMGGRSRSPALSWFDTDSGRYLTYTKQGWVTIAPADKPTLRHHLNESLNALAQHRP
jgi:EspG family